MGNVFEDEDDDLEELTDDLSASEGDGEETLGIDDGDFGSSEIDEAPEDVGLDVETQAAEDDELDLDADEDDPSLLEDSGLELDGELDEDIDEDGWTDGSEGAGSSFDDDGLEAEDDDPADADDGGLEGIEDPTLDDFVDEGETSISIEGDDLNAEEDPERVELDLE